VGDLLFVGGASARRLEQVRIRSIGELAQADPDLLRQVLGEKMSVQARAYANGIDPSPVRSQPEEAKGYSNSVTLEEDVTDLETADAILLALADSVSAHMRSESARAGGISVAIRYLDFKNRSHQCRLERPTDSTREIYATAKRLLRELWKDRRPLRLLSVSLTNLTREEDGEGQLSLFEEERREDREKDRKLDRAVDALRGKFGSDIIQRGTVLSSGVRVARKFKGQQDSGEN
jgi:DNA polymerase-4